MSGKKIKFLEKLVKQDKDTIFLLIAVGISFVVQTINIIMGKSFKEAIPILVISIFFCFGYIALKKNMSYEKGVVQKTLIFWFVIIFSVVGFITIILLLEFVGLPVSDKLKPLFSNKENITKSFLIPFVKSDSIKILYLPFNKYNSVSDDEFQKALSQSFINSANNDTFNVAFRCTDKNISNIDDSQAKEFLKKMNADIVIWGSIENSELNKRVTLKYRIRTIRQTSFKEKKTFESFIDDIEEGDLTENINANVYYLLGLEFFLKNNFEKMDYFFDKAIISAKNNKIKNTIVEEIDVHYQFLGMFGVFAKTGISLDSFPNGKGEFGLSKNNPIPVKGILSTTFFLSRLRYNNYPISWTRAGMTVSEQFGIIDIYCIKNRNDTICSLYFAPYNNKISTKCPKLFTLKMPLEDENLKAQKKGMEVLFYEKYDK